MNRPLSDEWNSGYKAGLSSAKSAEGYQGWSNKETWLVGLWLTNDEELYNEARGKSASELEELVEGMISDDYQHTYSGFISDLLGAALIRVDWDEIAASLKED